MKSKLWAYFALIVFAILLSTAVIVGIVAILSFRLGHLSANDGHPLFPIAILLFMSVFIGTAISLFVAKKILNPITKFSRAAAEVARGNFSIQLEETERVEEIRELTHNFNLMVRELSGIETLRNDFVVNVSHEFKTPIAAIEGFAALLQAPALDDEKRLRYASKIILNTKRLSSMTGNILELSRLERKEIGLDKTSYSLDEQLRQVVLLYEESWTRKELEINIDLPHVQYQGSEELMFQVWQNIFGNAVKFTHQGGEIGVRLNHCRGTLAISISDNGPGIPPEDKKRVFEKFYQCDKSHSDEGNGLGLAISKQIVELHGGTIEVKSAPGEGSEFLTLLPV